MYIDFLIAFFTFFKVTNKAFFFKQKNHHVLHLCIKRKTALKILVKPALCKHSLLIETFNGSS